MKKPLLFVLTLGLLLFLACVDDKKENNSVELNEKQFYNPLKEFSKIETQTFQLNLANNSILKGKDGTIIYFNRKNFNTSPSTPLTLHLEEYYNFKELLFNQISTETKDGKLLETSGVINIQVKADDGSKVELKKGKSLQVIFPDNKITNNDIYYGEKNEGGIVQWEKDSSLIDTTILDYQYQKVYGIDIYMSIKVPRDSLAYYLELNESFALEDIAIDSKNNNVNYDPIINPAKINLQRLNWVNVDRVIEPDGFKNILLSNEQITEDFTVYNPLCI